MEQDGTERREHTETPPERDLRSGEASRNPGGWKGRLVSAWVKKPIWARILIAGAGTGVVIGGVVLVSGALHPPPAPPVPSSGLTPGALRLRPAVPVRSVFPGQASVAGIVSAGAPGVPAPGGAPPSAGGSGTFPGPAPVPEGSPVPVSPEVLWRQIGSVAVAVARLSEAVSALSAEEAAVLRGQEWMMKEMTREAPPKAARDRFRSDRSSSSPLTDDRTSAPAAPAQPPLAGWRVIGVAGNGAVLMDPSGTDHLVRKDSVLEGRTVVSIDPESGHVRLSDGEVLTP